HAPRRGRAVRAREPPRLGGGARPAHGRAARATRARDRRRPALSLRRGPAPAAARARSRGHRVVIDRNDVLAKLVETARAASEIVMRVYGEEDVGAELKGPNDPVTRADKEANVLIVARLERDFPGVPIV